MKFMTSYKKMVHRMLFLVACPHVVFGIATLDTTNTTNRPSLKPQPYFSTIAKEVANTLPRYHIDHSLIDDTLSAEAFNIFFDSLDYDRSIFMAPDIEAFRQYTNQLDNFLLKGDSQFAFDVYNLFLERAENRYQFVKELLEGEFDFTKEESINVDREDAPWPENETAWDDLWRKKVKNDVLAIMVQEEIDRLESTNTISNATHVASANSNVVSGATNQLDQSSTPAPVQKKSPQEQVLKKYEQFIRVLRGHDEEFVLTLYLNAFTHGYDAHSSYMSRRNFEDFEINMTLKLIGIGARLSTQDAEGAAKIVSLIKGGPAERDGRLEPGDRIIAVGQGDEEPVDIMYYPLYKSVRLIRGEKGTKVVLHVIPAGNASGGKIKVVDLIRDEIQLEEQAAKSRVHTFEKDGVTNTFGIIELPEFYADLSGRAAGKAERLCSEDVKDIILDLKEKNVDGIVLDLRNNGGGALSEALAIAGFFIDEGPVVQVKSVMRRQILPDPDPSLIYDGPLTVLVNRHSASASEIVAAALQDYGRAIIIGDYTTHGKGSVQSLIKINPPLDKKYGQLKLTTAGFYRINGKTTQLNGVQPDIIIPSPLTALEIGEKYMDHHLKLNPIPPVRYNRWSNILRLAAAREDALVRLGGNDEYRKRMELVKKIRARIENDILPLTFDERLTYVQEGLALEKEQEEIFGTVRIDEDLDDDEKNQVLMERDQKDLLIQESFHILSELASPRKETAQSK